MNKFLHVGISPCPDHHGLGLKNYFESIGWEYRDIATSNPDLNDIIIATANEYKPTLMWCQIQSPGISQEAIRALKDNNCFCMQWSGDMRSILPTCYFNYAQWGVDLSTFSNMQDVNIMRKCGYEADFLQIGASQSIYNITGEVNNCCEVSFCGNTFGHFPLSGLRRDMVKELKRVFGDRFKAFGSGQPDGSHQPNNQYGESAIYRGSKIGINLSHFDAERYSSDRIFKMLMCGTLVLSKQYPGLEIDFLDNENLVVWHTISDLISKIDYYLNHDEPNRKRIALSGHRLAMSNYTFVKMGENIFKLYNQYNS